MSTAIVIDDSISTNYNPHDYKDDSGYTLRAEIAIAEAYLRRHPDAEIIGLNAGLVDDFDDLTPMGPTPQKEFIQALQDYDRVVLILDSPLEFNGNKKPNEIDILRKNIAIMDVSKVNKIINSNGGAELQIILVGEVEQLASRFGPNMVMSGFYADRFMLLAPHVTMIVDPRTILDFGF